jgi:hypothetical protein
VQVETNPARAIEHGLPVELDVRRVAEPLGEDRERIGIGLEGVHERAAASECGRHVADVGAAVDRDVAARHAESRDTALERARTKAPA